MRERRLPLQEALASEAYRKRYPKYALYIRNMVERLGGEPTLGEVVEYIYERYGNASVQEFYFKCVKSVARFLGLEEELRWLRDMTPPVDSSGTEWKERGQRLCEHIEGFLGHLRRVYEVNRTLESARRYLAFLLLWKTGMRVGELVRLRRSDFSRDGHLWRVRVRTLKRRGEHYRVIPFDLDREAESALEAVLSSGYENVFPSYVALVRYFRKHMPPGVRIHDIRHARASLAARVVSPFAVQRLLGHRLITTTMYYVEVPEEDLVRATRVV